MGDMGDGELFSFNQSFKQSINQSNDYLKAVLCLLRFSFVLYWILRSDTIECYGQIEGIGVNI